MHIPKDKKSVFSTDNFPLAIYLKSKNCKLLHVSKKNPKRAFFNFEESQLRKQLTNDFWNEKALVEPRAFYNAQRELKSFLYDKSYPAKTLEDSS